MPTEERTRINRDHTRRMKILIIPPSQSPLLSLNREKELRRKKFSFHHVPGNPKFHHDEIHKELPTEERTRINRDHTRRMKI